MRLSPFRNLPSSVELRKSLIASNCLHVVVAQGFSGNNRRFLMFLTSQLKMFYYQGLRMCCFVSVVPLSLGRFSDGEVEYDYPPCFLF